MAVVFELRICSQADDRFIKSLGLYESIQAAYSALQQNLGHDLLRGGYLEDLNADALYYRYNQSLNGYANLKMYHNDEVIVYMTRKKVNG